MICLLPFRAHPHPLHSLSKCNLHLCRNLSSTSRLFSFPVPSAPYQVFDRQSKRLQKDRSAQRIINGEDTSKVTDYLREEIADRLIERFMDVKSPPPTLVEICSGAGHFSQFLDPAMGVQKVQLVDMSEKMLHRDAEDEFNVDITRTYLPAETLINLTPNLTPNSQDAVISTFGLHWINDLPGFLRQINELLKPGGFFLGCMIGGETLFELRTSLQLASLERNGGVDQRVSPMIDPKDATALLQSAKFEGLTIDTEEITIHYPSAVELMLDLRDMGESNAVLGRPAFLKRDTIIAASAIYEALHTGSNSKTSPADDQRKGIPATFQCIFLMGWKPDPKNKSKVLERGSGQVPLTKVL